MLEWTEEYSSGDARVDEQHKVLFAKFNELGARVAAGYGREAIEGMVNFMGLYAKTHFAYEESCMARHKCGAAATNIEEHPNFLATFHSFHARLRKEGPTPELLSDFLTSGENWLRNHIMKVDVNLRHCGHP